MKKFDGLGILRDMRSAGDGSAEDPFTPSVVLVLPTRLVLTVDESSPEYGEEIALVATIATFLVTPATGSVTFRDGTTAVGSGSLSMGATTLAISTLSPGTHTIAAIYSDGPLWASSFDTLVITVGEADTTVTVTSAPGPSVFGEPVTVTATIAVAPPGVGDPTGTATFADGTATLGTGTIGAGLATYATASFAVGTHTLTSIYAGDGNFASSTSAGHVHTVTKASTSTVVTGPESGVEGETLAFTASVSVTAPGAGTPTGTVTFMEGTNSLGTGTLSGGIAAFTTASLSAGDNTLKAIYAGDANFIGSTSGDYVQTVML